MFKAISEDIRTMSLTSFCFLVNFENSSPLVLACHLLTLSTYLFAEFFSEEVLFLKKIDSQYHKENAWKTSVVNFDVLKVVYPLFPTRRLVRHN